MKGDKFTKTSLDTEYVSGKYVIMHSLYSGPGATISFPYMALLFSSLLFSMNKVWAPGRGMLRVAVGKGRYPGPQALERS